jgi:hypothetical protein
MVCFIRCCSNKPRCSLTSTSFECSSSSACFARPWFSFSKNRDVRCKVRKCRLTRILERQKMLQTSQVLSRRLCVSCAAVLPFKDSEGGTWPLQRLDFKRTYICQHAPVKKHSQYSGRSMGFAPQQQFGPAISEAAKPRCATVNAIKPPDTSRRSEARPR